MVDLPAPFGPTIPIRAPSGTTKSRSSNRLQDPKDFVMAESEISDTGFRPA